MLEWEEIGDSYKEWGNCDILNMNHVRANSNLDSNRPRIPEIFQVEESVRFVAFGTNFCTLSAARFCLIVNSYESWFTSTLVLREKFGKHSMTGTSKNPGR